MTRRVALVGGPMYDAPYDLLPDDVEVVVHADHGTLNAAVAEMLSAGERLDLISTHGKYVPSQAGWLRPLDELVDPARVAALAPAAVELCRFEGSLWCVPRNIDVRLLWWRTDLLNAAPRDWADVIASGQPFGFTGRGSGLFGMFYELVVGAGERIFDDGAHPILDSPAGIAAVETLVALAANAPAELLDWEYDAVDTALHEGRVAMAAAWPGGTAAIRRSPMAEVLAPARYPGGRSYSGCHGWAIPATAADVDGSVDLLHHLLGRDVVERDVASGSIPADLAALDAQPAIDEIDEARRRLTIDTVRDGMITYPPLVGFPAVEDAAWAAINDALAGRATAADTVARMQAAAVSALEGDR